MGLQQIPSKGGIPSGNTAARPGSPVIGDTFYNGQLELLEIYNGTSWVAASAPPATPTIATPTDASTADAYSSTAGKLSVVFTPGNGGSAATQYNAFTTAGGHSGSSSSTTVTISGLTPGTAYTVFGNAQNNFGTTVNTANASAVTPTTKPQAPSSVTATLSGVNVDVAWTLGNSGGKNLTALQVIPYLNGTTAQTAVNAASTSATTLTVTGLTIGSSYTFTVKATNANGFGESSATGSVTIPTVADFMLVAGGAGGGGAYGGGGGAGGFRVLTGLAIVTGTAYTVTVGNGGAGCTGAYPNGTVGGKGGNSSVSGSGFTTISATGGGGGGTHNTASGANGGSGGGHPLFSAGSAGLGNEGNYTPSEGNNGGDATEPGGGGGAGGSTANTDGGVGSSSYSSWGSATSSGQNSGGTYYYAGGGGAYPTGVGGLGGGGTGASSGAGTAGTANTGGGGGGGGGDFGGTGSTGGSGLIIIRRTGSITAASTTGSPTRYETGGYTYYKFTGSGSITY